MKQQARAPEEAGTNVSRWVRFLWFQADSYSNRYYSLDMMFTFPQYLFASRLPSVALLGVAVVVVLWEFICHTPNANRCIRIHKYSCAVPVLGPYRARWLVSSTLKV